MKSKTLLRFIILTSILNVAFIISGVLIGIYGFIQPYYAIFVTLFMFAFHLDIRILVAYICYLFTNKINIDKKKYLISKFEYQRLEKLKIKNWKDHFVTMFKDRFVLNGNDRKTRIEIILKNNIIAEITHWLCFFFGLLGILLGYLISKDELVVYIVTSIVAGILFDFPPILIQRYNRYRLLSLKKKLEDK